MSLKFRQLIRVPQKIDQIPEPMSAEPTGSIERMENPTIIARRATIMEIMNTLCACASLVVLYCSWHSLDSVFCASSSAWVTLICGGRANWSQKSSYCGEG